MRAIRHTGILAVAIDATNTRKRIRSDQQHKNRGPKMFVTIALLKPVLSHERIPAFKIV